MKTFACFVGIVLLGCVARADDDAMAVVDKAIKAHGGEDKLAKNRAGQWNGKGTMTAVGRTFAYSGTYYVQFPDKLRFDMDAEFMDMKMKLTVVSDGKKAWEAADGMVREMAKEKFEEFEHTRYGIHLCQLLPLKEKEYTLKATSEAKVNDKLALGVKVARKGKREVTLFFDKESGVLVKLQTKVKDEFAGWKEVKQENYFEFKDMDGLKVMHKMTIKRDGMLFIEEEFSEQKVLTRVPADLFAKPKGKE